MSDETAYENDVLLGVPEPADLPAGVSFLEKEEGQERLYERAHNATVQALELTRKELAERRRLIKDTYDEIKLLVAEEELLSRMARIKRSKR